LHEGLLAGERLHLSLRQMERAYLCENTREYELTKHFSLRLHFPLEFLRLKETDERHLPFEFHGAVSRWRIELPQENNQFDVDTLSDVVLHLNYTAREGGEVLRAVANDLAQRHLPGSGVRFFDFRHELPDAWHRFHQPHPDGQSKRQLDVRLSRDMFPFSPGRSIVRIERLDLFFQAPGAEPSTHHEVEFLIQYLDRTGKATRPR
jgi:hypothetical protein